MFQFRRPGGLRDIMSHDHPAAAPGQFRKPRRLQHALSLFLRGTGQLSPIGHGLPVKREVRDDRGRRQRTRVHDPGPGHDLPEMLKHVRPQRVGPEPLQHGVMQEREGQLLFHPGLIRRRHAHPSLFGGVHQQFGFRNVVQVEEFKKPIDVRDGLFSGRRDQCDLDPR